MRRPARTKKKNSKVRPGPYWISVAAAVLVAAVAAFTSRPAASPDKAAVLAGTVTKVVDGDTLDVRLQSGSIRVRLHGVDTPERGQPWGSEAFKALSELTRGKEVFLVPMQQDRYDRLVAIVKTNDSGSEVNVNAELVRLGHAWAYRRYMRRSEDAHLCHLEHDARSAGRGLWSLPAGQVIPPWDWRRDKKNARPEADFSVITASDCLSAIGVR